MKALLVIALSLALALMTVPTVDAKPDPPACVGYSMCYEQTGNGYAVFCVEYKGTWKCGECEACGNGPEVPIQD